MTNDEFADWVIREILRRKASWMHAVYKVILPPELYGLAKADKELDRVTAWTKAQGYAIHELTNNGWGETQMTKGNLIVGIFRPYLTKDKQLAFKADVMGKQVDFVDPENN